MPVRVRPAKAEDAPSIAALIVDHIAIKAAGLPGEFKPPGGDNTFRPEHAERMIAREKNVVRVAEIAGEVAGFAQAEFMQRAESPDRKGETMLYLYQLVVRDGLRRQGVGTALLDAIGEAGRERGAHLVMLDVWTFNEAARAFFRSRGFNVYNERLWNR